MKRMKAIVMVLAVFLLVGGVFTGAVMAQPGKEPMKEIPKKVLILKPNPNNYVNLDEVKLLTSSENHIRLMVKDTKEVGSAPIYFSIKVDLENKTYKTIKKEIPSERPTFSSYDLSSTSTYYAHVTLLTEDIVQLDCAETNHRLYWSTDGSTVTYVNHDVSAEGKTTIVGTHWYVDYDSYNGWYYSPDRTSVTSDYEAQYYNYDWHNDNLATRAWHRIKIRGNADATFDWWAYWDHWGEDYWLLHADVKVG